ncbi:MAG: hypothetical protein RBS49_06095 [Sphaerochaeta sp.]|jgi:hypothetical protein|nr:hypothetical protein [Sphaerochaeta sp.]MDX9915447.1 hypothetical protein [Sphaerochaeta sp.]
MKKSMMLAVLLTVAVTSLMAVPMGITLSTWGASRTVGSGQGIHVSGGAFIAPTPHLEIELNAIVGLTPRFGQDLFGSLFISYPFAGPLYHNGGEGTLYYNGLVALGYLGGWDHRNEQAVHALALRIIPFTLGGSYYGRRERALSFTVLYDVVDNSWAVSWSLLGFDIYL